MESHSLNNICQLISHCCECLSLWKVLCEHQFDLVANGLDQVTR